MKPMLTTAVARVKAVDTCALGTKADVVETRQLAANTTRMDARIATDFIVMDVLSSWYGGRFEKVQGGCQVTKVYVLAATTRSDLSGGELRLTVMIVVFENLR
jgi:hypothetical protein